MRMLIPIGSIVNALAVIIGSLIGLRLGSFIPDRVRKSIFQVIGLFTLILGTKMALETNQVLLLLISLVLGVLIGELLGIERILDKVSRLIKEKVKSKDKLFSEGLITAFLLYCVGSMTFVGAIEEGINNDKTLLYTKSLMDGVTSILLASSLGIGVLVSALPLLLFQSILTWGAFYFEGYLQPDMITELSAVGGVLIMAISLNILEILKIKVSNLLPALLLVIPIYNLVN